MKYRIYAYIHLVILVFYLIRPVLPYLEYALNKEYIAKNLCVNRAEPHGCCEGKCYLEKQIKKSNETNNDPNDKNSDKKIQNEEVNEFLSPHFTIPKIFETHITPQIRPDIPISMRFISAIFIPPKIEILL